MSPSSSVASGKSPHALDRVCLGSGRVRPDGVESLNVGGASKAVASLDLRDPEAAIDEIQRLAGG